MKIAYLKNFRQGLATNSSSTHSLIYKNDDELFKDLNIFDLDYYDRYDNTIAASREAKIKYVLACIMYNEPLVEIMSQFYPEMKQYFPKIKSEMEEKTEYGFGMYYRGDIHFRNNLEASIAFLRKVIDTPDIIIIGGSDERDFVYDTVKGHVEVPSPDDLWSGKADGVYKNGTYWLGYGTTNDRVVSNKGRDELDYDDTSSEIKNSFDGRIRFSMSKDDECIPEYPELIDLKITNMCEHGCPFCYMNATKDGGHAKLLFLLNVVSQFGMPSDSHYHRCEFSIGGGNILLYPDLDKLFEYMHSRGHIVNVTIKADDVSKILEDERLLELFDKYVNGIGVSVLDVTDIEKINALYDHTSIKSDFTLSKKYVVAHLIPELLGKEKTLVIKKALFENQRWVPMLFLGYKQTGRAIKSVDKFTEQDLDDLFEGYRKISVDTTFANTYTDYIKTHFSYKYSITNMEGEYSMYIDGVEEKAYKSSYNLEKPYNMHVEYPKKEKTYGVKDAFSEIRKDNGLKSYEEVAEHYYTDAKHYWEEE